MKCIFFLLENAAFLVIRLVRCGDVINPGRPKNFVNVDVAMILEH